MHQAIETHLRKRKQINMSLLFIFILNKAKQEAGVLVHTPLLNHLWVSGTQELCLFLPGSITIH